MSSSDLDSVVLEITDNCNLNCGHCGKYVENGDFNELTVDQVRKAVEWEPNKAIVLGGEPCLHSNLDEIIEVLSNRDIDTTLQTNGVILSQLHRSSQVDAEMLNKIDSIAISLDGDREMHNEVRGDGVFEKCMELVNALGLVKNQLDLWELMPHDPSHELIEELSQWVENVPKTGVRLTYSRRNIKQVLQVASRLMDKVDGVALFPLIGEEPGLPREMRRQLYSFAAEAGNVEILQTSFKHFLGMDNWSCPAGDDRVAVLSDGSVVDCYWRERVVGTVDQDLEEVMEGCDVINNCRPVPGSCSVCSSFDKCRGGCIVTRDWENCPVRHGGDVSGVVERGQVDMGSVNKSINRISSSTMGIC